MKLSLVIAEGPFFDPHLYLPFFALCGAIALMVAGGIIRLRKSENARAIGSRLGTVGIIGFFISIIALRWIYAHPF